VFFCLLTFLVVAVVAFEKDKIMKEKNEVESINELFEKKFANLELRELNA